MIKIAVIIGSVFNPGPQLERSVNAMLDQLIAWASALKTLQKT